MMKRTFAAALGASLLLVALPSVASAHHRRAACRASTHKHHAKCAHARAHVLSFGPTSGAPASNTGTAPSTTTPTPGPTETAGTVTKYAAPMLTITLNDKTEVTGKVTENTRIECESTAPAGGGDEGDDDGGGGEASHDSGAGLSGHGDTAVARTANAGDDEGEGNDQGDDGGTTQPCTTSALMPGTFVRSAELLLTGEGPIWEKVLLIS